MARKRAVKPGMDQPKALKAVDKEKAGKRPDRHYAARRSLPGRALIGRAMIGVAAAPPHGAIAV